MAAQIPALFETLSGMQMSELLSKVRKIGDKAPKPAIPGERRLPVMFAEDSRCGARSPGPGAAETFARESGKENAMALLDRVCTLIRANLNDLVEKAEDPEKMIKQVLLDMENQLLQLKTQVAVAIADQHMLEKKKKENEGATADWMRKAERAVDKQQDGLARVALERQRSSQQLAQSYQEQVADQARR